MTAKTQREKAAPTREELFARFCAHLGNPWEAARRAGFHPYLADAAACSLMAKPAVRRRIRQHEKALEKQAKSLALRGLMRMAGYCAQDGAKLARDGETLSSDEVGRLDLFGVSSLKWSGSGCEVKFFDRMRALELLLALESGDASPAGIYQALRASAARLDLEREEPDACGGEDGGF